MLSRSRIRYHSAATHEYILSAQDAKLLSDRAATCYEIACGLECAGTLFCAQEAVGYVVANECDISLGGG